MEELAAISASLGAMGSLAEKLRDTELKDDMGKLKTRLYHLSKTRDPPLAASRWMNDVRGLSYEMENCVDTETDWIHKIIRFKARLKDSNGRYDRYDLEGVLSHTNNTDPMIVGHRLPTVHGGREPDPVVGLDAAVGTLWHVLTDGDEQLKVLSIVGVGGIGKTTLVKQLWRKHKSGDYFHCGAFVRTAKQPDMRRILRSILAQVRPHQPPDANEVQELIDDIREHLQDKRYFVIIDDLWATSVWDVARRAFPDGNGSRILTTTEIEEVALACCTYQLKYVFNMEPLIDSHSKQLFTGAVFGYGEQTSPQSDKVSDEIIRRCAGLPLAIISISSVLASQGEINTLQNMEKIVNILPTNTTPEDIIRQVLNFCYNCLPSSLQTCLLYLSLYPENYMILKEDIVKQWVGEGFILAPTEKDKMEVAGSYFEKLVTMGLIQHIDVDYSDEVLYYAVHHTVHDLITSKSTEQNFITAIDYSQRTARFSNKVSRLSLQFGSATYATKPDSIGLSQVRSLAFIGLKSCFPPISEFIVLRSLILHIWADQQSSSIDLKPTSELVMLRSLQVTCNGTVHLPDLMQGLKHLETLEINAVVAAIPASIVHLRSWLHLRLGVGTELHDVTGIIKNATLNRPISLNESSSPPNVVLTIELLPPICSIPKWIGQLTNLCSLKIVVRELDDTSSLQGLPSLTVLSLHVQRRIKEVVSFATGAFVALEYFDLRCGVLRLIFHKGTIPNLQRLKLGFNAHRGEQYGCSLVGIEDLLSVQNISAIIGVPTGAKEYDYDAAVSKFKKAIGKHYSKVSIKRADMFEEEFDPPEEQHFIRGQHPSTSSEQPEIQPQGSQENTKQNADSVTRSIKSVRADYSTWRAATRPPTPATAESTSSKLGGVKKADPQSVVGTILTVIQLIEREASTASQNKDKCLKFAERVRNLAVILFDLSFVSTNDRAMMGVLERLSDAVGEALRLIQSYQAGRVFSKIIRNKADQLDSIEKGINNCIMDLALINQTRVHTTTSKNKVVAAGSVPASQRSASSAHVACPPLQDKQHLGREQKSSGQPGSGKQEPQLDSSSRGGSPTLRSKGSSLSYLVQQLITWHDM